MISVSQLHTRIRNQADIPEDVRYPDPLIDEYINRAQNSVMERYYKLYELNQITSDVIAPFVVQKYTTAGTFGEVTLVTSDNYRHILTMSTGSLTVQNKVGTAGIFIAKKLNEILNDSYLKPTDDEPVFIQLAAGTFEIHGTDAGAIPSFKGKTILVRFLRNPVEVFLSGAIDSEFPAFAENELINEAVLLIGITRGVNASQVETSLLNIKRETS